MSVSLTAWQHDSGVFLRWGAPGQSAGRRWRRASPPACTPSPGSRRGRCLRESNVKNITATSCADTQLNPPPPPLIGQDTEEVEGPGDVDDGVSGLRLLPWGELDDFLGCLQELWHSGPGTVAFRALEEKRRRKRWLICAKRCVRSDWTAWCGAEIKATALTFPKLSVCCW